jgi:hypothetical protein
MRARRHAGDPLGGRPTELDPIVISPGLRIGRLLVLSTIPGDHSTPRRHRVQCDCGNVTIQSSSDLKRAVRQGWGSCGCMAGRPRAVEA